MSGRQAGKAKPLKAPKKDKRDLDEDDVAFKNKQKADEKVCEIYSVVLWLTSPQAKAEAVKKCKWSL